jgi:predicted aspartyl protease
MGLTEVQFSISNPANPKTKVTMKFLVDSEAAYSPIPRFVLRQLGIKLHPKQTFILANGELIERARGDALFEYKSHRAAFPVIFGENGDSNLLGVVTLESLGFGLDSFRRELKPMPMP